MTSRSFLVAAVLALFSFQNSFAAPPDASGKWKWTIERNGESQEITMTVKQEGGKITGAIAGPQGREVEIRNGRVTDQGNIAFYINLERNGNTLKIDFAGKIHEGAIDGKTEYTTRDGERRELDWKAKRVSAKSLSGNWTSTITRQDGNSMESTLALKQNEDALSGHVAFNGNETEIRDGKVKDGHVAFKTVRERNGRTITSKYHGKIQPDGSIKGSIESDWTGEVHTLDWAARKEN